MQFQVPQFLDVEDKIFGPLTLKQFLYLAGAAGFSFILFFVVEEWLWITFTVVLGTIASSLAFVKYNGRPLIYSLLYAIKFAWQPKMYLWRYTAPQREEVRVLNQGKYSSTGSPLQNLLNRFQGGAR
jgi:hypothetical protein